MGNFLEYNPEQAYLLPPTVREVLGDEHLCFLCMAQVEKLDLREFTASYKDMMRDIRRIIRHCC